MSVFATGQSWLSLMVVDSLIRNQIERIDWVINVIQAASELFLTKYFPADVRTDNSTRPGSYGAS